MRTISAILLICALSAIQSSRILSTQDGVSKKLDVLRESRESGEGSEDEHQEVDPVIYIAFIALLLAIGFYFLIEICPPLCRSESGLHPRRYMDTQLRIGEII